jgi:hypothetical protein
MTIKYNPSTGKIIGKRFSLRRIQAVIEGDNSTGFCRACGHSQGCCEPDARRYECESCGHKQVYGAEELLMMGLVSISRTTMSTSTMSGPYAMRLTSSKGAPRHDAAPSLSHLEASRALLGLGAAARGATRAEG